VHELPPCRSGSCWPIGSERSGSGGGERAHRRHGFLATAWQPSSIGTPTLSCSPPECPVAMAACQRSTRARNGFCNRVLSRAGPASAWCSSRPPPPGCTAGGQHRAGGRPGLPHLVVRAGTSSRWKSTVAASTVDHVHLRLRAHGRAPGARTPVASLAGTPDQARDGDRLHRARHRDLIDVIDVVAIADALLDRRNIPGKRSTCFGVAVRVENINPACRVAGWASRQPREVI